uniref:3-isopropylmalate dehydrogenase n=1 Tax=Anthurium amnicola TaxID=1678845 RepID=A0A1D1YIQ5_9ARAE
MKEKPLLPDHRSKLLVWFAVIVCMILVVAIIITGIVVLGVYLAYRPKMPYIRVRDTHLDDLLYDQFGRLDVRMTINIEAVNDNTKADATFSDIAFDLQFARIPIARLRAEPFEVSKNNTFLLPYSVESSPVPLGAEAMEKMDKALKQGTVAFDLGGQAKTRWRVGVFVSIRFWTHLDCTLQYFTVNHTSTDLDCTSRSH